MNWFMHHAVLLALVGASVAVGYGLWLTTWLLKQPPGNERMREISGHQFLSDDVPLVVGAYLGAERVPATGMSPMRICWQRLALQ